MDPGRLAVSLTKNGYLKIADLLERHDIDVVLDHVRGDIPGVNLVASQVTGILGAIDGVVPELWGEIRRHSRRRLRCFVAVAVIISHHRLIDHFRQRMSNLRGRISRNALSSKVYTNLVYALHLLDACELVRSADHTDVELSGVVLELAPVGDILKQLVELRLRRCGWVPSRQSFQSACDELELHKVLGMTRTQFRDLLSGNYAVD